MEKTVEAVGGLMFRYFFESKAIFFGLTPQLLILTPEIFYLDLAEYYYLSFILWLSIPLSILNDQAIVTLMRRTEKRLIPDDLREKFVEKLFWAIRAILRIEKYYLNSKQLMKNLIDTN